MSRPGDQQYGPPPGSGPQYGPQYGPPPWPISTPLAWPHGPGIPGVATAAVVLGRVTAGLTIAVSLTVVVPALGGRDGASLWLVLLGLPCAVGMIVGAGRLMRRRSPQLLLASAAEAVAVLVLLCVVGLGELPPDELLIMAGFVVLALPLPLLTAIFAGLRTVRDWVAAGPG